MNDTPDGSPAPGSADKPTVKRPPASDTAVFPQIDGYTIERKLGEGGMGDVFLAEDRKLGRKVAIKTMKPELAANPRDRERFLREARAAAKVTNDHIVPILHIGEANDSTPFIVMPFLQGESLDARLKREPVASVELILKVAGEVAEGLTAAHVAGLIHRDIKPGNVWLERGFSAKELGAERCKILDFGLVRSVEPEGDAERTASGAILGTPAYMAPEQARGEKVDPRADLFSLGAMLYRMATGRLPFDGPTPMAILIAVTTEMPLPVHSLAPHLPTELLDLIVRLMFKDRDRRPHSAAEVSELVERLKGQKPVAARGRPPADAPAPNPISTSRPQLLTERFGRPVPPKRTLLPWVIAAACLFALMPLGLWRAGAFGEKKPEDNVVNNGSSPKSGNPAGKQDEPPKTDPDRAAAEYMLSIGNVVHLNGEAREYKALAELPGESFRLSYVDLASNRNLTDAGLANFRGCKNLTEVYLMETPVGDAGLAHFKNCPWLHTLGLDKTAVTDAGLVHLKELKNLTRLTLTQTKVSAAGVTDLAKALPRCDIKWDGPAAPKPTDPDRTAAEYVLSIGGTVWVNDRPITDLKQLPKGPFRLEAIRVSGRPATDAGLANCKDCKNLVRLDLSDTEVSDEGFVHFKECKNLMELDLAFTHVTDASVDQLKQFTHLKDLDVTQTKLSPEKRAELRKALPKCAIKPKQ